jgi:serine/threonine-protein kinase
MADYLAPELTIAGKSPDAASDAYALGCTLYVLLTGELPFAGGTAAQKLVRHGKEAPKGR